jgi:molecular chaperone DnaK
MELERELLSTVRNFRDNDDQIQEIRASQFLEDLKLIKEKVFKLKENDKSDFKYVVAEKLLQISKEFDKMGGNERLAQLVEEYLNLKDSALINIENADFSKDELRKKFQKIIENENSFLNSKNHSALNFKVKQLMDLIHEAEANNLSTLIYYFNYYKQLSPDYYNDYKSAQTIIKLADKALEENNNELFRKNVYYLSSLTKTSVSKQFIDYKGTGIG